MSTKMNSSETLEKLRNKEKVEVKGFDFSGYFDNQEAYEAALKKADEENIDKSERSQFLEEILGSDVYKSVTSGLKSIDYAIKRIEELEGIAYLRNALITGDMSAFSRYRVRAYPRIYKRVKNRETGDYSYNLKTIFKKHIKEAYYLSFPGGMSDRPKDPIHNSLIDFAKNMILTHSLTVNEEEHIAVAKLKHPEGRNDITLEFRVTVDLEENK